MERKVSAFEARRNFGELLEDVAAHGDNVVVERHGKPVAVVVPLRVYEQWQRSREEFFNNMREMAQNANLEPDEADRLAEEAVQWARSRKPIEA